MVAFSGGEKLERRLKEIADRIASGSAVKVGFLEGSTYPDGTSVPLVASVQEFGGTVKVPEHQIEIFRSISADGEFLKDGRFVKREKSNFASVHDVAAHEIKIPARPYFRPMINAKKGGWGQQLSVLLKRNKYDTKKTLSQMGAVIAGELRESILSVSGPALAKSTVAKKGSSKLLVDTGHMLGSVDYEVE